jgi:hypothetical protein
MKCPLARSILVTVALAACLGGPRDARAITAGAHVVTADPMADTQCSTPAATSSFLPTATAAYLWFEANGAKVGDVAEWRFFGPGGAPYVNDTITFDFDGDGCAWLGINIAGQQAASLPGAWRVDLYLNGVFVVSADFSIAGTKAAGGGAAHLAFAINEQVLVPWAYVNLSYRIQSFKPGLPVDLHLVLLPAGAGTPCADDAIFSSMLPPFAGDLTLSNTQTTILAGYLPGQVAPFTMKLYGVLVGRGASPADPANWVSNLAVLDLAFANLSSRQAEILARQGNPQAFIVGFDHVRQERSETWFYRGGALGDLFHFVNGAAVGNGESAGHDHADGGTPTPFDPGKFTPSTTTTQLRNLLGDPDHIVRGAAGRRTWIFDHARITVVIDNGVITQVGAR